MPPPSSIESLKVEDVRIEEPIKHNSGGHFGHISGVCIGGIVVQTSFSTYFNALENLNLETGVISIYHAGGVFAVVASAYVSDQRGRKASFLFNSIFYIVGNILNIAAQNWAMLFIGRFLSGFGSYGFLYSSSIYVMEQAPARSRGVLTIFSNGIAMEVGYIIGSWASVGYVDWSNGTGSTWSWRFPFLLNLLPVIILVILYPTVPESARWLISKGRDQEALDVLQRLHASAKDPDQSFALAEHRYIVEQFEIDRTLPTTWWSMFTTYRKRTLTSLLILWGFLLGGCYFLASPTLFVAFGYSTRKSTIYQAATLMFLIVNWIGAPLIDRVGRKPFLVVGLAGELIILIILMVLSKEYGDGQNKAGAKAFTAFFLFNEVVIAITEPAAYLMSAEVFPLHVRTKGCALSFGFLAVTNTWVLESAGTMVRNLGWKAYLLFVAFSSLNVALFIWLLPETKNVPLEDMAVLFGDKDQVAQHSSAAISPEEKGHASVAA